MCSVVHTWQQGEAKSLWVHGITFSQCRKIFCTWCVGWTDSFLLLMSWWFMQICVFGAAHRNCAMTCSMDESYKRCLGVQFVCPETPALSSLSLHSKDWNRWRVFNHWMRVLKLWICKWIGCLNNDSSGLGIHCFKIGLLSNCLPPPAYQVTHWKHLLSHQPVPWGSIGSLDNNRLLWDLAGKKMCSSFSWVPISLQVEWSSPIILMDLASTTTLKSHGQHSIALHAYITCLYGVETPNSSRYGLHLKWGRTWERSEAIWLRCLPPLKSKRLIPWNVYAILPIIPLLPNITDVLIHLPNMCVAFVHFTRLPCVAANVCGMDIQHMLNMWSAYSMNTFDDKLMLRCVNCLLPWLQVVLLYSDCTL